MSLEICDRKIQVLRRGLPEPGSKTSERLEGFQPPRTLPGGLKISNGPPKSLSGASQGLPGTGRCLEALQKVQGGLHGGPGQVRKTPPARKFRFCVGGRLRPEGLLIVSILYAGVRLEEKFRFCAGASQNLAPKLRRALRAFNLPEPFQAS